MLVELTLIQYTKPFQKAARVLWERTKEPFPMFASHRQTVRGFYVSTVRKSRSQFTIQMIRHKELRNYVVVTINHTQALIILLTPKYSSLVENYDLELRSRPSPSEYFSTESKIRALMKFGVNRINGRKTIVFIMPVHFAFG